MLTELTINEYLEKEDQLIIIDVRSPGEYYKGHIPGAINIPLFNDEERAEVGTKYVQQSREKAIALAYQIVEPKRQFFIEEAHKAAVNNKLAIHCWRGGMRSKAFAEHIESNGIAEVFVIKRGYKAFRKHVLDSFEVDCKLNILGGYTGSGKTEILKQLKTQGEQCIDLEALANHKGSVFGGMGKRIELSTEQFENNLYWEWKKLDFSKAIWLEDQSASIGPVNIPAGLYKKMREAPVIFLEIPKEKRAEYLASDYESCNNIVLTENVLKISKRLGGLNTQDAINYINQNNYFEAAMILLNYYDKYYLKGLSKRNPDLVKHVEADSVNHAENAILVSNCLKHLTSA